MNIQELESRCGVTKQNIRFYERKGLLHPDRNLANNYREYNMEDVERLQFIKMMRKLDVSIEDIREVLEGRYPMEDLMQKHLEELENRKKELDAGVKICKKLLHTQLKELDTSAVLKEMDEMEARGGKFVKIMEFTEALLTYAKENDLNLVITKEGMYPVFEVDGVEYTAERTFGRFGAVIHCQMTHPEKLEKEFATVSEKQRKWFKLCKIVWAPLFLLFFFMITRGSIVGGLIAGIGMIPFLVWAFQN